MVWQSFKPKKKLGRNRCRYHGNPSRNLRILFAYLTLRMGTVTLFLLRWVSMSDIRSGKKVFSQCGRLLWNNVSITPNPQPRLSPLSLNNPLTTKKYRVGDRARVGAQSSACLRAECFECSHIHAPTLCPLKVDTYNAKYPDGSKSLGGYANYARHPFSILIKIPDGISSEHAAPMLCAGITPYSPPKQNGCGPGKKVGIVPIRGLGHLGMLYAKVRFLDIYENFLSPLLLQEGVFRAKDLILGRVKGITRGKNRSDKPLPL